MEKPVKFVFRISFTNSGGAPESAIVMAEGKDSALPGQKPVGDTCISAQAAAVAFVNAGHILSVSEIARDVEVVGTVAPRVRVNPPPPNVIPVPAGQLNAGEVARVRAALEKA